MKKVLLFTLLSAFVFAVYSQSEEKFYYNGVEKNQELKLTPEQVAKIKKINREKGSKFAAIGKDRAISGQEKGRRKRALALEHKAEIQGILTSEQIGIWENKYGKQEYDQGIKNSLTNNIDNRLDALKEKYEQEEKAIEDDYSLSKAEQKNRKKALKETYKIEKEKLKKEKNSVKSNVLLQ